MIVHTAGIPHDRWKDHTDEFAILLDSGRTFYTGGFESAQSLAAAMADAWWTTQIAGCFQPNSDRYWPATIDPAKVECIVDLRASA